MLNGYDATPKLWHESIKVIRDHGKKKVRQAMGYVRGNVGNNIFFYNNSYSVVIRALTERLYYVKGQDGFVPCPRPSVDFKQTLKSFTSKLLKRLPSLPTVWTNEQFVRSYTGSKAKRYQRASERLGATGPKRSYGYWKTFIKAEFYDGSSKNNPCPRLIQPRSPEYNVLVGRFLRPAEKLIYKAIDRVYKHHVVLKCDSPWQRAETIRSYWGEFRNPVFVGLDASRFDQHVSPEALEYEHSVYNAIFNDPELREYLSWQIENVGYASSPEFEIRYQSRGVRGSGDMNTALGNVLLMCAITHHYLSELPCRWRFINDGDDCGIFMEAEDLHYLDALPNHHLRFGFEMEVEPPAYEIEHVEFCQSRPINCGNGRYMMVRNIHKAIKQDAVVIDLRNWASVDAVLAATGICGLALYEGMPVLDEFYRWLGTMSTDDKIISRLLDDHFMGPRTWRSFASQRRDFQIDVDVARVSIYKAFGILPDAQRELEVEFRALRQSQFTTKRPVNNSPADKIQYYQD